MKKILLALFVVLLMSGMAGGQAFAQEWYPLYKGRIPVNLSDTLQVSPPSSGYSSPTQPGIEVFRPAAGKANGTGLLIFPGGAYSFLSWEREGINIARAFNEKRITCFIVKYRLPDPELFVNTDGVPLADAIAMRWVKNKSVDYELDVSKLGIIGFSAGGHLASTLGNRAPADARPAFMLLVYPVVSMQPGLTHQGSHDRLLGKMAPAERERYYSNELQVNEHTPPAYITHAGDDGLVPVENSILLYEALIRHHIPAELYLPQRGDHGFIFGIPVRDWLEPMISWLKKNDLVR